jgi:hypothetical protein
VNTTDILRTLHGLAVEDRAWIIARLPTRAKAQLLAMSPEDDTPDEVAELETPQEQREAIPADIDAGRLALVLAEEPAWIAAVVRGSTEPWVAALTPHTRQTVIRSVLARVGCGEPAPTRSRFQSLLARLSASRSRKRLTIRL